MDTNTFDASFPKLSMTEQFEEQVVSFYFHLTRKSGVESIEVLGSHFSSMLETLSKTTSIETRLSILYKLIAHTRDIIQGKGEHDLAYMMVWKLYACFPKLTVRMIRHFVMGFGSWRDVKYICQYIRKQSPHGPDDPLIGVCIKLMNTQLKRDLHTWKYSIHAFSRDHISNVAKWIPREHKKFDWLYEKLVVDWTRQQFPVLLETPFSVSDERFIDSYQRAIYKAKRLYRKTISLLNKGLNTPEIRLCSNTTDKLIPREVSKFMVMKHPALVFEKGSAENFQRFYKEKYSLGECSHDIFVEKPIRSPPPPPPPSSESVSEALSDSFSESVSESLSESDIESNLSPITNHNDGGVHAFTGWHSVLPFSYFVEKGLSLVRRRRCVDESLPHNLEFEIQLLNAQWSEIIRMFPEKFDSILPIVDVSFPMQHPDKEPFYTAVGMALFLSETSTVGKRILALDNLPIWINLENATDFISKLDVFDIETQSCQNTYCNSIAGIDLIMEGLRASNMTRNYINDLELVLFSNFYGVNLHPQSMSDLYMRCCSAFSKLIDARSYPRMVFWNLNKGDVAEHVFPPRTTGDNDSLFCATNPRLRFFSGFSPMVMRCLSDTKRMTAYESICHILDHDRYNVLDTDIS
jgi:hypothetical protein